MKSLSRSSNRSGNEAHVPDDACHYAKSASVSLAPSSGTLIGVLSSVLRAKRRVTALSFAARPGGRSFQVRRAGVGHAERRNDRDERPVERELLDHLFELFEIDRLRYERAGASVEIGR